MTIKADPELQHVLAHLIAAIRYTSEGDVEAARYELDSIEGLVLFDTDEEFVGFTRGQDDGEETKAAEPLQGEPLPEPATPEEAETP